MNCVVASVLFNEKSPRNYERAITYDKHEQLSISIMFSFDVASPSEMINTTIQSNLVAKTASYFLQLKTL